MPWLLIFSLNVTQPTPVAMMQGFVSTGVLRSFCEASDDDPDHGQLLCLGYLAGVTDQLLARESRRRVTRRKICLPADLKVDDLRDAVLAYQAMTDTSDDVAAAASVRVALEATFPCGTLGGGR